MGVLTAKPRKAPQNEEHGDVAAVPRVPVQVLPIVGRELAGLRHLGQLDKVEAAAGEKYGQERQQQSDAAYHGVHKELGRRARASRATPEADQEERRNQAQLPVEEPVLKLSAV